MNALTFQTPDTGPDLTLITLAVLGVMLIGTVLLALWRRRRQTAARRPQEAHLPATPPAAESSAPPSAGTPATPAAAAQAPAVAPALPLVAPQTGPYLEFEGAQGGTRRFYIGNGPLTIGRASDSDVCITETLPGWDSVSRTHARVLRETINGQTRTVIEDLQSHNGVFVNGRRTGRNVLRDGWRVSIGRLTFTYRSNEGASARERRVAA